MDQEVHRRARAAADALLGGLTLLDVLVAQLAQALRVELHVLGAGGVGVDRTGSPAVVDRSPAVVPIHRGDLRRRCLAEVPFKRQRPHEAHVGREQDQLLNLPLRLRLVSGDRVDGRPGEF